MTITPAETFTVLIIIALAVFSALAYLITHDRGQRADRHGLFTGSGDTITITPQTGIADDTGLPPEMQPAPLPDMLPAPVPEQGDQPCQESPASTASSPSSAATPPVGASSGAGSTTTTRTPITAPRTSVTAPSPQPQPDDDDPHPWETPTRRDFDNLTAEAEQLFRRAAEYDLATAELLGDPVWPAQEPFMAMLSDETIARGMPAVTA